MTQKTTQKSILRRISGLIARQLYKLLILIFAVVVAMIIITYIYASQSNVSFISVFPDALFIAGLIILAVGGLVGAGFSERAVYGAGAVWGGGKYLHHTQKERLSRRDEQFVFMLFAVIAGLIVMALAYFIGVYT